MNAEQKQLSMLLTAPFPPDAVHWKPLLVRDGRALAVAFLDARSVMRRLDEVFGVAGWQTRLEFLPSGTVVCTLSVKIGDVWIVKTDVGSPSDQADEGDRLKAAASDALKRAAVHLGIGRLYYRLPPQWVEYDVQRKQFKQTPTLPSWALPAANGNGHQPAKGDRP
jgi:hypothetical protein